MSYRFYTIFSKYCLTPLLFLLGSVIALIVVVCIVWKKRKSLELKHVLILLAVTAISILFIITDSITLCNGRIALLKDNPKNTVQVEGTLTEVLEVINDGSEYTNVNFKKAYEIAITVNGEKYYMIKYCNGIEIGDLVELTVLPHSRFVLRIKKVRESRNN